MSRDTSIRALCSRCLERPQRRGQRYCGPCHAAYMRENRPPYSELTEAARRKANARSTANVAVQRGKLERQPCSHCGAPIAQKHHEDYDKPLEVTWLCGPCHARAHAAPSCEWHPTESRAATTDDPPHAAAKMAVGAVKTWHLCLACAALPEFRRYRRRRWLK